MQNCLAELADLFAKDGLPDERMLIAVSAPFSSCRFISAITDPIALVLKCFMFTSHFSV
jgi:hypothetical protein